MHDLIIEGGSIVDGSGAPAFTGDILIDGDRLSAVTRTRSGSRARRRIKADGLTVSPGFIDPHTHYDAQFCWDGLLTSSPEHGVTTVVTGNCGVGLAPARPDLHEVLIGDLVHVEGMPYEALRQGLDWRWQSFGEYLNAMDDMGLGINVAALVAMTPLRHWVMGAAARERAATATEAAEMAKVFRQAMQDGAFGFSTTVLGIHVGHEGQPLACRHADHGEYRALCGVLKDLDRGAIELTVTPTDTVSAAQRDLLQLLVEESGRPVTYVGSFNTPGTRDTYVQKMAALTDLIGRDRLVPQTTCHPIKFQFHLRNPFILGIFECWRPVMAMSQEDKIRAYRAPEFRQQFRRDILKNEALSVDFWDRVRLIDGQGAATLKLAESKHSVARMAADAGRDPVDVMFEIAFADDLGAIFELVALNHDAAEVVPLIQDPRLLIGLSDAGAHVDMMCDAGYATYMLARWVREQKVLRMEDAVRRLTSEQAQFFGIPARGTLKPGYYADLALFDAQRVRPLESEKVFDLPGGGKRWVQHAEGMFATLVNGAVLYQQGEHQGPMPGRALRSGEVLA
jgi:N-acyl-D-amino-acid deacylase